MHPIVLSLLPEPRSFKANVTSLDMKVIRRLHLEENLPTAIGQVGNAVADLPTGPQDLVA